MTESDPTPHKSLQEGIESGPDGAIPARRRRLPRIHREYGLLLLFLAVFFYFSRTADGFFTLRNVVSALQFSAPLGVIAVGMTLVILTGGIDLSVGSAAALSAVMLALIWKATGSGAAAVGAALLTGAAAGAFNGLLVTRGRIPALIVTLATLSVYRGLAFMLGGTDTVGQFSRQVLSWGEDMVLGLPIPIWLTLVLMAGAWIYLSRTAGGRSIYALGANAAAARLSGIPVGAILLRLYLFTGLMAGLAAVIHAGLYDSVRADIGREHELAVITMVVLGGTSVAGGEGSIAGTLLGYLTIVFIRRGLELQGQPSELNGIAVAVLLVAALLLDAGFRARVMAFRPRAETPPTAAPPGEGAGSPVA